MLTGPPPSSTELGTSSELRCQTSYLAEWLLGNNGVDIAIQFREILLP